MLPLSDCRTGSFCVKHSFCLFHQIQFLLAGSIRAELWAEPWLPYVLLPAHKVDAIPSN